MGGMAHGSSGAYTDSLGIKVIRQHVAEFIEHRDGHAADYKNIAL